MIFRKLFRPFFLRSQSKSLPHLYLLQSRTSFHYCQQRWFASSKVLAVNRDDSEYTFASMFNSSIQIENQSEASHNLEKPQFKLIFTEKATKKVKQLQNRDETKKYLKIFVDEGGCSGLQYNFQMVHSREEDELIFEKNGAQFLVDEKTLEFINGSVIDFKEEMIRQAFEVVENPNAELGCSCGTSFAPKDK